MPIISEFYGISIYMYYEDHNPPHFHAIFNEDKVIVDIQKGCVIKGCLPTKQIKLVLAWCEIHREELMKDWFISKEFGELVSIDALR